MKLTYNGHSGEAAFTPLGLMKTGEETKDLTAEQAAKLLRTGNFAASSVRMERKIIRETAEASAKDAAKEVAESKKKGRG